MRLSRSVNYVTLLLLLLLTFLPLASVTAQAEKIEMTATNSKIENTADSRFEWEVNLSYKGGERPREFDLNATTTATGHFTVTTQKGYETTKIRSITLEPDKDFPDKVKVVALPIPWDLPDPGEYNISLEAASGQVKGGIDLVAVVTARYDLEAYAPQGNLWHQATAGKESTYTFSVANTGTSAIGDINFRASKPGEWTVTFNPEKIESLDAGATRDVEAKIKPGEKTLAGDYMVTVTTTSRDARDELEVRVSIATSTLWGWVGIGIVIAVIAGLAVTFTRLGRR